MELIDRDELKEKLDRGETFKLVMVLGGWAFRAKHIPGSINVSTPDEVAEMLAPEDEIVVYCSNEACPASPFAYRLLTASGYANVRRYAGGLADWEAAGYPIEGEAADQS